MNDAAESMMLPSPPRPLSPRVRRRAWAEPTVRFWWLLALALLILSPILGAQSVRRWYTLSRLVEQPPVKAKLLRTERDDIVGRPVLPGATVQIEVGAGDESRRLEGTLQGWSKGPLPRLGDVIEIRRAPDQPTTWTVMDQPPSFLGSLAPSLAIVAVAFLPFVVSLQLRQRVLRTWCNGQVSSASIVARQQTALAPGAYAIRCAWIPSDDQPERKADRAVFSLFIPKTRAPAAGESSVDVLALPRGGKRVAVDWFTV